MFNEKQVSDQYAHGSLVGAIEAALPKIGKTSETVTIEDLASIDEFHVGGRQATDHLIEQLNLPEKSHMLDVGCGLGGAARYIADKYKACVTGIDLTLEYIQTGNTLSRWLQMEKNVQLLHGSALSMPFQDNNFDGAYMLHVGMNISDKPLLFSQIYRVLNPGSFIGIYDMMRFKEDEISYPVPWASDHHTCKIDTPGQYKKALLDTGFKIVKEKNRRDFALRFFNKIRDKVKKNGGPPPLGLHTLMQGSAAAKTRNMVHNITEGYIAPVEMVAIKTA